MDKKYGVNGLRELFLKFFEEKGHLRLPSFPLVPQNDKSLLLINSGMAPMKPYFKGEQKPPRTRVCTCQKCIRTGDIENIGKTARHGTFFEMLGNFSFGDYFKHDAIRWSWEFLTDPKWVGLDPNRLYPSVYEEDDESFEIWNREIGVAAERIYRFGKKDNFWEHGAGPCGPCSEIYYDRGAQYGCGKEGCTVGCDCDRYMEIWNNVFTQFDNDGAGHYTELKQKNIDTGMGLERLAVACQDVYSLFDVDTVMHITNRVTGLTGVSYGSSEKMDVSLRVITDHIRSAVFMICDSVLPSNEGRGYVLRRLLRRAARHGKLLCMNEPFLYQVVETVVEASECQYPDLREKAAYITRIVQTEEESFAKTIDGGVKIFMECLDAHRERGDTVFSGEDAFRLYDTFGFPVDLTAEMVEEAGLTLDQEGFQKLMQEQRTRARKAREALGDLGWTGIEFGKEVADTAFVGYDRTETDAKILAIVADSEPRESVVAGTEAIVVLDRTVLYAEMGGQVADTGVIENTGTSFRVTDVQKSKGGKFMHYGRVEHGELRVGGFVRATYDRDRRAAICRAHSATHLLQAALGKVLGEHVHQAGSLVEPDRLRFDFTHFSAVTAEELSEIQTLVNDWILDALPIKVRELPVDQAKKLGATALFGEKYGAVVRVVFMGDESLELCGGTHLCNTAGAGAFCVLGEASIASGVRRIECVTGKAVLRELEEAKETIAHVGEILRASGDVTKRAEQLMEEAREQKRVIEQYQAKESAGGADALLRSAAEISGLHLVTERRESGDVAALRQLGDILRDKDGAVVAVLSLIADGKVTLLIVCGRDAVARGIRAGDLIREIAPIIGGRGGGKPDSAMGGGSDAGKLSEAFRAAGNYVKNIVE